MTEKAEVLEKKEAGEASPPSTSPTSRSAIEVRNLTKYYADFLAVDNISFDVKEGEILGFLGPNGAGKSTTIKVLTCFLPASSGKVNVAGYDVFSQSLQVRQNIGYMPENVPLYPEMRVREYLKFRATIKNIPRHERDKRIDYVLEKCGIEDMYRKVIGQLSKGYRQRVGLADALISDPPILILDEPLASLDPNQQTVAKELIKSLKGRHTIIFSTHILTDVEEIADRMVIIDNGKVVGSGTPEEFAQRFQEEQHLRVEVVGPENEIRETVESLEGVNSVESSEHEGLVILKIKSESEADIREQLSKTIVQKNWPLRELRPERMELAEIFARLTAGK